MSKLQLNMVPRGYSPLSAVVLGIAVLGCAEAVYQRAVLLNAIETKTVAVHRAEKAAVWRPTATATTLNAASVAAVAQIAQELKMPWDTMLDSLQLATDSKVALVKIQPDVAAGQIAIHGRASSTTAFLAYLQALGRVPQLQDVQPVSEDVGADLMSDKPVAFQLQARWKERP